MKKIITIVLNVILLVGCSLTNEDKIVNEQETNLVNNIENNFENLTIDHNWNIPTEGEISGIFCGFIDNHSFELLGEDDNYYAVRVSDFLDEKFENLESNKTKITIDYTIENETGQLILVKIKEIN